MVKDVCVCVGGHMCACACVGAGFGARPPRVYSSVILLLQVRGFEKFSFFHIMSPTVMVRQ